MIAFKITAYPSHFLVMWCAPTIVGREVKTCIFPLILSKGSTSSSINREKIHVRRVLPPFMSQPILNLNQSVFIKFTDNV